MVRNESIRSTYVGTNLVFIVGLFYSFFNSRTLNLEIQLFSNKGAIPLLGVPHPCLPQLNIFLFIQRFPSLAILCRIKHAMITRILMHLNC